MKTIIKFFVAVSAFMACTLPAMTQDTIHSHALPEHLWYYGGWPDSILTDTTSGVIVYLGPFVVARYYGIIKHTDSALTIYGIAAAFMYESDPGVVYRVQHPAMSDLNDEHLQLWEMNDNSIWQVGHDILIPVSNGPQYYWDLGLHTPNNPYEPSPMYEGYFDEPVVVEGDFMVGMMQSNGFKTTPELQREGIIRQTRHGGIESYWIYDTNGNRLFNDAEMTRGDKVVYGDTSEGGDWELLQGYSTTSLIFPIITPNPDTNRTQDSLGIGRMTPVERNTVVSPNPATGAVRVASGFGLQHIEVYDAAGRRVYAADATGLQTHIDVGSWPRGAYTVHVRTAVGTAIKKLLVQ